jgi:hypothetical protein
MARFALVEQFAAGKLDHFDTPEAMLRIALGQDFVDPPIEGGVPARVWRSGGGRSSIELTLRG